jgi:hypothetical protein
MIPWAAAKVKSPGVPPHPAVLVARLAKRIGGEYLTYKQNGPRWVSTPWPWGGSEGTNA